MSNDPNADVSKSGSSSGAVTGPSGLNLLVLNTILVVLAVLIFQLFFRLVNGALSSMGSYFTLRNILIMLGFALLFAFLYGKFAGLCCNRKKKARIPINVDPGESRSFINRILNALLFALLACAVIWFGLELVDATGYTDTDGDGVKDTVDILFIAIVFASALAVKGGGGEEGGDDATDPGGQTGLSSGGR